MRNDLKDVQVWCTTKLPVRAAVVPDKRHNGDVPDCQHTHMRTWLLW